MRQKLLFILLIFVTINLFSQEVKRIEISGKIIVNSDDIDGVTVYNASSNKGTVTDHKGHFLINVALNDRIEFGALQFKDFIVVIDEDVIVSKEITVYLIEEVNKLDEVVILPYDLTGNLVVDLESVKTFNPDMDAIYFGIKHMDEYDFTSDYKVKIENNTMHSQGQTMVNGLNVVNLVGAMIKPLFKSKNRNKVDVKNRKVDIPINILKMYYSNKFLIDNFEIPKDKIEEFVAYVENNGLEDNLLKPGKEMEFLEFINEKSRLFLNSLSEKN